MSGESAIPLDSFVTFGDLLKYLRRRARLTQREIAIAVNYSEAHISRLEQNQRPPDLAALTALFIPALYLEDEPEIVARLLELAAQARGEEAPRGGILTFSGSARKEVIESLQTEEGVKTNLPLHLTSFIGREREITEIKKLLDPAHGKARLVTLTGSGGCGKTRLALETAGRLTQAYEDGIWLIELAPILDPVLVLQVAATTLHIPESQDSALPGAIIKYLRTKHVLLILDNCEQVVSAAAQLAEDILRACPHAQILATSREILNIPGEIRFRVPSLSLPQDETLLPDNFSSIESVRLFVERAQAAFPPFEFTKDNAPSVAQICRRLDGIPLAIELAAARMTALSIQQIAARLEDSFQILSGGSVTVARHQTLRATIEWSYGLLSEPERTLFERLSVFSGGWTLAAAESVVGDASGLAKGSLLDLLAQLVNKSLVTVEWQSKVETRYKMLQTIHDFARERLNATGKTEKLRASHFAYFLKSAELAEPRLFAVESSLDWAEAEIDNLRAALTWALDEGNADFPSEERTRQGLELMAYVWPLWLYRGYLTEGREWMKQLLAAHPFPTLARARALLIRGDFARADGDYTGQMTFIQESLTLAKKHGDKKRIAWALMELAAIDLDHHRYSEAVPLQLESLQLFQELQEELWVCRLCFFLAETYVANGDPESARPYLMQGLEISRALNDNWHTAIGLEGLGNLERLEGRFRQAREFYLESLNLRRGVMDRVGITYLLKAIAQLAASQGQFDRAAMLWGAAEKLHQSLGFLPTPLRERFYTTLIPTARERLGKKFAEAWDTGRAMKLDEAIQYALTPPDEKDSVLFN